MSPCTNEFVSHCLELLDALGPCHARRMFGGWGLYAGEIMVGLIADESLYLKADDQTRAQWEAAGSQPFSYRGKGRLIRLSYWLAPGEAMESPAQMAPWARLALQAALRGRQDRRPRKAPGRSPAKKPGKESG